MTLTLRCQDHGFECDFILEGEKNIALLKKLSILKKNMELITHVVITQMIINRDHIGIYSKRIVYFLYF